MNDSFLDYFKCPERYAQLGLRGPLSATTGYFHFGPDNVCYGRLCQPQNGRDAGAMRDVLDEVRIDGSNVDLPFDVREVVDNLRLELYPSSAQNEQSMADSVLMAAYYAVRPVL